MNEQATKHYVSLLVENHSGVLSRITGLIARRGFNIDSLTVCATENDDYSRMTIAITVDEKTLKQLQAQLTKQIEVIKVTELSSDSMLRELLLIKVRSSTAVLSQLVDITAIYKAKTIDIDEESVTFELTGRAQKLDSFISNLAPYGIIELARSGVNALQRGKCCLKED